MRYFLSLIFCLLLVLNGAAQFTAGQKYFSDSSWIEYQAGNMPIILLAPHGGYLEPNYLLDRDCVGCVYLRDAYTQEITRETAEELHRLTGCYPHVVINRLHRRKLDANREIIEATDSNALARPAWFAFHAFADSARAAVTRKYGKGLLIDIHGHAHAIERLELGTLIYDSDLRKSDSFINTAAVMNRSSMKQLILNNQNNYTHAELIRGEDALGSLMMDFGFPAIPSDSIPLLISGDPFFNGGYDVARHGSRDSGFVDAIQIEGNRNVRWDALNRVKYADSLAHALLAFIETHYFLGFNTQSCWPLSFKSLENGKTTVYPNPTNGIVRIESAEDLKSVRLYDLNGKLLMKQFSSRAILDLGAQGLNNGVYLLEIELLSGKLTRRKLILMKN